MLLGIAVFVVGGGDIGGWVAAAVFSGGTEGPDGSVGGSIGDALDLALGAAVGGIAGGVLSMVLVTVLGRRDERSRNG